MPLHPPLRVGVAILLLLLMAAALIYAAIRVRRRQRRRDSGIMVNLVGGAPQRPQPPLNGEAGKGFSPR